MVERPDLKNLILIAGAVGLGVALALTGVYALDRQSGPPIVIEPASLEIAVWVGGAVATPGLYVVSNDARMNDAIVAAGGLREDADPSGINLAERLDDEDRIEIPFKTSAIAGQVDPVATPEGAPISIRAEPVSESKAGKIDINSASAEVLETLPEIGPAIATRIVEYRTANGRFATVDELARVDGVSPRMVDALRELIVAGP